MKSPQASFLYGRPIIGKPKRYLGKKPRNHAVFCTSKGWMSKVPKRGCKMGVLAFRREPNPHNNRIERNEMASRRKTVGHLTSKIHSRSQESNLQNKRPAFFIFRKKVHQMIKVKITGKAGASLQKELPTDIYQLYHDMREAGISKPPKNILPLFGMRHP